MRPDIIVRDQMGEPVLAVEVKARRDVDRRWASQLRRNLRSHGAVLPAKFFMIVTAESVFLWHEEDADQSDQRLPDAQAPLADVLGHDTTTRHSVSGRALELIVLSWLSVTAGAADLGDLPESARAFLVHSGLFEALRGAAAAFEPA